MNLSSHPPARVAAVVVEYHSGQALERCIASLRENLIDEIVVVDNGAPGVVSAIRGALVPGLSVVEAPSNLGFGGGVNLGAANTDAELLLICNPDIVLEPGALAQLRSRLDSDDQLGAVGPALIDATGRVTQSARSFPAVRSSWQQAFLGLLHPSGRRSRDYRARNWSRAEGGLVDWVTGACLLVRSDAFRQIGGFDDRYFLYVEEVDFCWRLHDAGWQVLYEPRARVTHTGGVSTSAHPYRAIAIHHRSLWLFIRRTTSGADRAALPVIGMGLVVRCGFACVLQTRRTLGRRLRISPARRAGLPGGEGGGQLV